MMAVSSSELNSLITKLQTNNTKFLQKLDLCEDQLSSIKTKTLPIETKTNSSTKRKKDLDTKLSDTEKIMNYLNTSSEVGPAIEIDLRVNPFGKQKLLFDSFDRLSEARQFLFEYRKKVATAAAEFESVDRYFKEIVAICLDGFHDAVSGVKLTSVIDVENGVIGESNTISDALQHAKNTIIHLEDSGIEDFYKLYVATRQLLLKQKAQPGASVKGKGDKSKAIITSMVSERSSLSAVNNGGGTGNNNMRGTFTRQFSTMADAITGSSGVGAVDADAKTISELWEALEMDLPFRRGESPFESICTDIEAILRGEVRLWATIFPDSAKARSAFSAIASTAVEIIPALLHPWLTADPSTLSQSSLLRNINVFLCKLDMIEIFLGYYDDLMDLCRAGNSDSFTSVDNNATRALQGLRNAFLQGFSQTCNSLLQLPWDQVDKVLMNKSSSRGGSNFLTSSASMNTSRQGKATGPGTLSKMTSMMVDTKRSTLTGTDDSDSACDVHSVTSAALHCCRVLNTVSPLFYDDQLVPMISRLGIRLSSKATTLHQLLVSLIKTLLEHISSLADDILPANTTTQMRPLDINAHALYDSGGKDACVSLQWAKKQMFLVNNYYTLLTYLSDRRNEEKELLNQAKSDVRLKQAVNGWEILLAEVDKKFTAARFDFCESVAYALSMTAEDMSHFQAAYGPENKQGRARVLKAKFSLFNSGMAAFQNVRGDWRATSSAVKEALTRELVQVIIPTYSEFFRSYSNEQFSKKHMSEYLVYSPQSAEKIFCQFF